MKHVRTVFILFLSILLLLSSCGGTAEPVTTEPETALESTTEALTSQAPAEPDSLPIRVLSQNLRNANDPNGNSLRERRVRFTYMMEDYAPDLVGTQETTQDWEGFLKKTYGAQYEILGCSRDGRNENTGERNSIMFRKDRFELLESDTFWLTDTPEKVSAVNGAKCKRICTWALLREKETGVTFVFANTHLDHSNDSVRNVQAGYLIQGLQKFSGTYPIFLTGDFNATNSSSPYFTITKSLADSHRNANKKTATVYGTFHSYGSSMKEIDFVFFDAVLATAENYYVVSDDYGGYVSDHYGVLVDFRIPLSEDGENASNS